MSRVMKHPSLSKHRLASVIPGVGGTRTHANTSIPTPTLSRRRQYTLTASRLPPFTYCATPSLEAQDL